MKLNKQDDDTPAHIRTLDFFGAAMEKTSSNQFVGSCVFCGKEDHFYCDEKEGLWDCKRCGRHGNPTTFLEQLMKAAEEETEKTEIVKLEASRKLPWAEMKLHGLAYAGGRWLMPVKAETGRVRAIRTYDYKQLIYAAGLQAQLWGVERLKAAKPGTRVYVCEGEWDGIAMSWLLRRAGLLKDQIVVAVPGAGTFKKPWMFLLKDMDVIYLYDNDEAGDRGAERAAEFSEGLVRKARFVHWPHSLKKGYDTRDFIVERASTDPEAALEELLGLCKSQPRTATQLKKDKEEEIIDPISWSELVETLKGRVEFSSDMEDCLALMMAVVLSNDIPGDPLWMYVVAPPGAGKTLLIASLATSSRCLLRSSVTPHCLVSGWRGDADKDPSLIPKLAGLTFVAKDFTEILTMPQIAQDEVFSTLRGAYDGSVSKTFGNGATREYKDCRFSMLAGVTHAIHASKTASLGERFLKFQFRKFTRSHAEAAVQLAIASVGAEAEIESALCRATSAYLQKKISSATLPKLPDVYIRRLTALVQLIALLRAQVERDPRTDQIKYRPEPEAGTRLAKQLSKLSRILAAVWELPEVDERCYSLVERVAFDTAYGFHADIVDAMMQAGGSCTRKDIAQKAHVSSSSVYRYVEDLILLKVIAKSGETQQEAGRPADLYQVTDKVAELWARSKGKTWTASSKQTKNSSESSTKRSGLKLTLRSSKLP